MLAMTNPALLPAIEAERRGHLADGLARLRRTHSGDVQSDCDMIRADPTRPGSTCRSCCAWRPAR